MRIGIERIRGLRRAALLAVAVIALPGADAQRAVQVGEPLGSAEMRGLNGPSRSLASFRGKPLLINVWASWCEPCRAEMKSFDRLAWLPIGRQINLIGVSTDDRVEDAQAWLAQSNATISQFIDSGLQMETMLGASTLPLTVLVSANGTVLGKIHGAREWDGPEAIGLIRSTFALAP